MLQKLFSRSIRTVSATTPTLNSNSNDLRRQALANFQCIRNVYAPPAPTTKNTHPYSSPPIASQERSTPAPPSPLGNTIQREKPEWQGPSKCKDAENGEKCRVPKFPAWVPTMFIFVMGLYVGWLNRQLAVSQVMMEVSKIRVGELQSEVEILRGVW
ncbi:hypothetical protein GLAREA_10102 [Glarea lozoyensis ATCC 20868]|uniref:Uncharacterized protein n=1 Tax=Glarea lozoyensis (strain ATCC 20868 / MF5171) TaxID=1116229 RepID=S3E7U4_GLAL2|nr:uncharacterized protein GLAREA_10102 [Glarea lozoyensis ATCC 20868]EPE34408.1 hypothetical protein GLAREA_10102 [Glarea lozoyensis ATCC 20868]